ncbi:MAG: radical SAM family heme chaperone HemW [Hyphomicrobiaceae bacterium]
MQAGQRNPDDVGFGIYLHWPFCAAKCPYCDFNSHVRHGGIDEASFVAAYLAEIDRWAATLGPRRITSVFFGGGTPSLMSPQAVAMLIERLDLCWGLGEGVEITLEANPTSVEANRFAGYRAAGVNRVSLGVQALRDKDLAALGRLHSADEARAAVAVAMRSFDRVSFDLIYARTGQTIADWRAELAEALDLAAGHLSLYQLTIEPETPFAALHAAGRLSIPDPEAADALYVLTREMTEARGLSIYEISNHARPGEESRHNLLYWRYGEYVGIGPGAHGRPIIDGVRVATSTEKNPERWRDLAARGDLDLELREPLSADAVADEVLLMGLRLREGVDLKRLARLGGVRPSPSVMDDLASQGLIESPDRARLRVTEQGRFVLNRIVLALSESFEPELNGQRLGPLPVAR